MLNLLAISIYSTLRHQPVSFPFPGIHFYQERGCFDHHALLRKPPVKTNEFIRFPKQWDRKPAHIYRLLSGTLVGPWTVPRLRSPTQARSTHTNYSSSLFLVVALRHSSRDDRTWRVSCTWRVSLHFVLRFVAHVIDFVADDLRNPIDVNLIAAQSILCDRGTEIEISERESLKGKI